MKATIVLTVVQDKKKAMAWLRKLGYGVKEITGIMKSLPYEFKTHEFDLKAWVPHCYSVSMFEALKEAKEWFSSITLPTDSGFEFVLEKETTDSELKMLDDMISRVKELKDALEWYEFQPIEVKRKIELLNSSSVPRG